MKDESRKSTDNPQENYPRPADSDKQFKEQDEFVQKQANRTDSKSEQTPEQSRGGSSEETLGNP